MPGLSIGRKLAMTGATIVTIAVALGAAVAFNPYLTAKPAGKLPADARELPRKRLATVSPPGGLTARDLGRSEERFPDDALFDFTEKTRVVLVQGFGRFGPFGRAVPTRGCDLTSRQDLGNGPLVAAGAGRTAESIRLGCAQLRDGKPPFGLALVVWAVCAWAVVTLYLPMAWDRYQLPIQSGNALLAAVGITCLWDRLAPAFGPWLKIARA